MYVCLCVLLYPDHLWLICGRRTDMISFLLLIVVDHTVMDRQTEAREWNETRNNDMFARDQDSSDRREKNEKDRRDRQ